MTRVHQAAARTPRTPPMDLIQSGRGSINQRARPQYGWPDWTGVSDIGRVVGGRMVERADYLQVEDAYVEAVRRFMDAACVHELQVVDVERRAVGEWIPAAWAPTVRAWMATLREGMRVHGESLEQIVRLALRETIWCRLKGAAGFYVHFGHDFYMYVGSSAPVMATPDMPTGIYAEQFESPYLAD